ncbi:MAG: ferritin family protein [Chloroflexota bacterium]
MYQTISELFTVSLQLEREAHIIYSKWAKAFAAYPEIASFWLQYAQEELRHAKLLEKARSSLSPEQLMSGTGVSSFLTTFDLLQNLKQFEEKIINLEDAYQFAKKMEHSEINTLFEFLVSRSLLFEMSEVSDGISHHIDRLENDFPAEFRNPDKRRNIKVN